MEVWEGGLGPNHPDLVAAYTNLAAAQSDLGGNSEAEAAFQRAITIAERRLGENHPLTAEAYLHYAGLLRKMGRKREAKAFRKNGNAVLAFHSEENLLGYTVDVRSLRPRR